MIRYIVKRLLIMIPILLGVGLIIFSLMELMPGDPGTNILGSTGTKEDVDALNELLGYNRPFIVRYADYMIGVFTRLDFGNSYSSQKAVITEIAGRFPYTMQIALFSIILSSAIGTCLGILSAVKQYSFMDTFTTVVALFLASVPGFWLGMLLMRLFAEKLQWLPTSGVGTWKNMVLPIATLTFGGLASLLRMTRTQMLETIRQDYIRTAKAKGAPQRIVIWRHALKNALLPLVTIFIMNFGAMMGGALITETVFAIPGMGTYMLTGIRNHDVPVVMGTALILAFITCFLALVTDLIYAFIDPRVKAKYSK